MIWRRLGPCRRAFHRAISGTRNMADSNLWAARWVVAAQCMLHCSLGPLSAIGMCLFCGEGTDLHKEVTSHLPLWQELQLRSFVGIP